MRWRTLLALVAVPMFAACNSKTLVIESDTSWSGEVQGYVTLSGRDNATIDLDNAPQNFCWTVAKTTSAGTLRAYLKEEDWLGLSKDYVGDAKTTEPNGEIGGCVQ
jgi:hypothetical protein